MSFRGWRAWWRRKDKPNPGRELRERALSVSPGELGLVPGPDLPRVWAILMETGYEQAAASLVVFGDGSTSLYFSNGGGMIGCGEHAAVRAAGVRLLAAAEAHLESFSSAADTDLPGLGRVRFYARTFEGLVGAEAGEVELGENRHPLSPLFMVGHEVITAIRQVQPPA